MLAFAILAQLASAPAPVDTAPPPALPAESASSSTKEPRRRVELVAQLGIAAGGTNWSGDALGYGSVLLGVRLFRVITAFGMARIGYARVDQRILTMLSLGLQGTYPVHDKYYPFLRLGFVHQHEESVAAAAENPAGTVLGIGTGIRHRAGLQAGLGCDFVLWRGRRGDLVLGPEATFAYLGYSSGPSYYGLVGLQAGGSITLF
jgi:hypothetical protein